jgi:cytidylate kinase
MRPVSVSEYLRDKTQDNTVLRQVGPFVTISRQYGCHGYLLAVRLAELLNAGSAQAHPWTVYGSEGLEELARQVRLPLEVLEHQRRHEPGLMEEFLRHMSHEDMPSCWELRRRIVEVIRRLASSGRAIIVGHGGTCATQGLPCGLSIRLEAPRPWRIKQVASRKGIDEDAAAHQISTGEQEQEYLRRIYNVRFPRCPGFDLTYDCSAFTAEEIAQHVAALMRIRGMTSISCPRS